MTQNIKLAADAVVFGYDKTGIYLLLIERKHSARGVNWAVPGGFVEDSETTETAAIRELKEETGVVVKSMRQFQVYDAVKRDPRGRVVSVAHLVLMKKNNVNPKGNDDAKSAQWIAINNLPSLAFDHNEMVETAYNRLKRSIASLSIDCMNETPSMEEVKMISKLLKKKLRITN